MDYLSTSVPSSPLSEHSIDIDDIDLDIELSRTASEASTLDSTSSSALFTGNKSAWPHSLSP